MEGKASGHTDNEGFLHWLPLSTERGHGQHLLAEPIRLAHMAKGHSWTSPERHTAQPDSYSQHEHTFPEATSMSRTRYQRSGCSPGRRGFVGQEGLGAVQQSRIHWGRCLSGIRSMHLPRGNDASAKQTQSQQKLVNFAPGPSLLSTFFLKSVLQVCLLRNPSPELSTRHP